MPAESIGRDRIEVKGIVQGVGFRPFVSALAQRLGLRGFVKNHSSGVSIEIEGDRTSLVQFAECLRREAPPLSRIDAVEIIAQAPDGSQSFAIIASEAIASTSTPISPDVGTCDECFAEFRDPQNRRYRYPFTNCTNCGPRYTIIRDIPYDRPLTTMSVFPMCEACDREYHDPSNRRYHAQPNACPACGPTIWFSYGGNSGSVATPVGAEFAGDRAIEAFHRSIALERIVATKGIGGFHLACSAVSSTAIQRLRQRKGRVDKPLAIMAADVATARQFAFINESEERLLTSRERPIVLLRKRPNSELSEFVAPGNESVGIMLPYSPLHALLVERQALVMTSGNLSEEPIVRTNQEAVDRLSSIADDFLFHNREIHVVCDDSVVRVGCGNELPIRRSRGYAPMPIRWDRSGPSVLAVGGELKATFCMTRENYAFMGPHIGDMGNLETMAAFHRAVDHFQRLFRINPEIVACDLHPGYVSSRWAADYAQKSGLPIVDVQHHHAHIASVLAEHRYDCDRPAIGISFDGTGYGPDGAIWGGEVLIATCRAYQRWAHLKYIPLPGADASIRHPYRSALSHLWSAGVPWDDRLPCVEACLPGERNLLRRQLERNLNCVPTSSMGRLFDAIAALIGIRQSVNYEAQAAIEMEALAADGESVSTYPLDISSESPWIVDPSAMLTAIAHDVIEQVPRGEIICRFHHTISRLIVELCTRIRDRERLTDVALSGGVFQNVLLLKLTLEQLAQAGFTVLVHRIVPPNDGGLALGQAAIARSSMSLTQL